MTTALFPDAALPELDRLERIIGEAEQAGLLKEIGRAAALRDADRLFGDLQCFARTTFRPNPPLSPFVSNPE